ncbi:MAG: nitrate- and nitrite sensing domain-containing protein, partial [Sulfurimicrobium sp.]|nr:nitrate- and nitrite sensing domain-containing protein [Sulfurimicrobium sp.]
MSASTIKTRTKLIFMVTIPILGLLYFSITGTLEKTALSREMVKLEALSGLSVKIGALAHELQKERGMSAGFLGSKGAKFALELPTQRKETDGKIEALRAGMAGFDASKFEPSLKAMLDSAQKELGDLNAKREGVTALTIPAPEAIGFYTKTIGLFLAVPGQTPNLSSNSEVARAATTYYSLLQAKERAGIERALLSNAFSVDKFTPALLTRFFSNSAAQETFTGLFVNFAQPAQKAFYDTKITGNVIDEVARMKQQAVDKASEPSLGGVDPTIWFSAMTSKINLLKEVEDRLASDLIGTAQGLQQQAEKMMLFYILLTILSISGTLIFATILIRSLLRQLGGEPGDAAQVAHNIAAGKLDNMITVGKGDDTSLMASMKNMQQQLLDRITEERKNAAETTRIKVALDNATTKAMIADNEGNIVYANKSVLEMMQNAENDIRLQLPNFSAAGVVGGHFDAFHKNPVHQRQMLAALKSTYSTVIRVGPRIFNLTANPVVNELGDRLGTSVEWFDATQEHRIQAEVQELVSAAVNGDFSKRLDLSDKAGFMRDLSEGINQLSEITQNGLSDVLHVAEAMAVGDLTKTIDKEYHGLFGQTKEGVNATVENLKKLVFDIKESVDAINTASKEIAAGNNDLSQRTEQQASSLEETASSMEELTSTVKQNADNAKQANQLAIGA